MSQLAKYLHEVGMLNDTLRSGFAFLGAGEQSVAEHTFRMMHVAFLLARRTKTKIDELRLLRLVMFHDLPEARTADHNYVNRKYVTEDLGKFAVRNAVMLRFIPCCVTRSGVRLMTGGGLPL